MKISIITISFNQAIFLEECIKSVLNQRNDGIDLEYIVVDPGSTDGSRDIIDKYRNKIDRIIFEKDDGPADGLNKGFSYATGEIFGFINADDYLLPKSLKKVVDVFSSNNDYDVISAHGHVIDEKNKRKYSIFSFRLSRMKFDQLRFVYDCSCLVQQSTFFRKKIFERVGGFDNAYRAIWDADLFIRFALNNAKFKKINDYWGCFRIHSLSITGSGLGLPTNQTGQKYFKMLQTNVSSKKLSKSHIRILWFMGWLSEPILLFYRLVDQIKHSNCRH